MTNTTTNEIQTKKAYCWTHETFGEHFYTDDCNWECENCWYIIVTATDHADDCKGQTITVNNTKTIMFKYQATEHSAQIEVGTLDSEFDINDPSKAQRVFEFGSEATVSVQSKSYIGSLAQATVGIGGVGSHDTDFARQRILAYQKAVEIADLINEAIANEEENDGFGIVEAVEALNDRVSGLLTEWSYTS